MERDDSDKIDPELVKHVQFDLKTSESATFDWKITPEETSLLDEAEKVFLWSLNKFLDQRRILDCQGY